MSLCFATTSYTLKLSGQREDNVFFVRETSRKFQGMVQLGMPFIPEAQILLK